eukprot:7016691-Ditylum_brightwellii.AAC.1
MTNAGNETSPVSSTAQQQNGSLLPFLDHDFQGYYNSEWFQWEIKVQLLNKGTTQLNLTNKLGNKVKHYC